MNSLRRILSLTTILITLAGCTAKPVPEDNYYRLTLTEPAASVAKLPQGVILVERFAADGVSGGRPIVFSESSRPDVAQTYHYDFWMEPPPILLQTALADRLRKAGASQVVTPELRVEPDYVITGRIRAFEQVRGADGTVRVKLELAMTERAGNKLVVFKSYTAEPKTGGDTIGSAVAQLSSAVDQIYSQFLKDLAAR